MKYIRTKDGVYDEKKYKVAKAFISIIEEEQRKIMPAKETDFSIIKQADTIEELCDEFVYIDDTFKNVLYKDLEPIRVLIKLRHNYKVYGAIWTDKGLIYIAKMNDKGELELL